MKFIYITFLFSLLFIGCSEEFLDRYPIDQLSEKTAFVTNDNFQTYAWSFYSTFPGYVGKISYLQELDSDLMVKNSGVQGQAMFFQRRIVPASSDLWNQQYAKIRRIHLMLANIEGSELTDEQKSHWKSVGLFFRAYEHILLLNAFGGVPIVDKLLTETDEVLYGFRASRDEVAKFILDDLKWAEENINPEGSGPNTINTNVVRALISRFGLIEGTWRKYHELGGGQVYLDACIDASEKLMTAYPTIHDNYDEVFNSLELGGVPGIIFYKAYTELGSLGALYSYHNRSSIGSEDLTKKAVDMYLCTDGQSIHTSPLFDGDKDAYDEFRNRDHRLYYNTLPPYRVTRINDATWDYHPDPKHREYIDLMAQISDFDHKMLPNWVWAGALVKTAPHFRKYNEGLGANVTYSGYPLQKYYNHYVNVSFKDPNDCPIFRMGEVLLNYAEAKFEVGEFDQSIADATINKLRARGHVAPLVVTNIAEDPTRDADVDPVLWEIRRERSVELIAEGFGRAYDIRRWKKLVEYGADEKVGRWIKRSDYGNRIPVVGGGTEGYIKIFGEPLGVPEHYYLDPLPLDQLVLNPSLVQNPGWENN